MNMIGHQRPGMAIAVAQNLHDTQSSPMGQSLALNSQLFPDEFTKTIFNL
jgi:hypothetical protein